MRSQLTPQSAAQRQARISCEHGQLVGACTQTYSSSVESLPNSTCEIGSQGSNCSNYQTCLLRLQMPSINRLLCRASQAASRLMPRLGPGERARLRCSTASGRTCRPWARATASSPPAPAGLRPSRPPPRRHARSRCGRSRYRPRQPRPCRAACRPAAAQPQTARRRRHCRLHASEWLWVEVDISSCRSAACARRFVTQSAESNSLGPLISPHISKCCNEHLHTTMSRPGYSSMLPASPDGGGSQPSHTRTRGTQSRNSTAQGLA